MLKEDVSSDIRESNYFIALMFALNRSLTKQTSSLSASFSFLTQNPIKPTSLETLVSLNAKITTLSRTLHLYTFGFYRIPAFIKGV